MSNIVQGLIGGGSGNSFKAKSADIINPYGSSDAAQQAWQQGQNNINTNLNQLQGVANGTGPNPAQAMLANATGANTANQAALMAGQRGSGANAGLIARQAAMQGGANQQNAAGQGAALQAQQSLNAMNQYGNMALGNQGLNQQAISGLNNANVSNTSQQNQVNGAIANTVAKQQGDLMGGLINGLGPAAAMGMQSLGGMFSGGANPIAAMNQGSMAAAPAGVAEGNWAGLAEGGPVSSAPHMSGPSPFAQHILSTMSGTQAPMMAEGGKVPALVSPGEKYLNPQAVQAVSQGADPMKVGQTIPGKPKVSGAKNSYANDTVPKTLDEGGIVLPRSVTQSKNPHWAAHKFVSQIMAKKGKL